MYQLGKYTIYFQVFWEHECLILALYFQKMVDNAEEGTSGFSQGSEYTLPLSQETFQYLFTE